MRSDDEILVLFADADPARRHVTPPNVPAGDYLDSLQQRADATVAFDPLDTSRRPMWSVLAAAAAVALVVGGLILLTGSDRDDQTPIAVEPDLPDTTEAPASTTTTPSTTTTIAEATAPTELQLSRPDSNLFDTIQPGTYRSDSLGTAFELTVAEALTLVEVQPGRIVLGDRRVQALGDNDIIMLRASALVDPLRLRDRDAETWPVNDIDGWIATATSQLEISDLQELDIDGRPARQFDVVVGDDLGCVTSGCIDFAQNETGLAPLGTSSRYRVWWISQGELDPIVIVAAGLRAPDAFLDTAEALVLTLTLGETQPNPVESG